MDAAGDLFIADTFNNVIRQVTGGIITTIAGNGIGSYSGDNGPPLPAGLNAPIGVATDSTGRIFLADSSNNLIRVMSPPCSFALTTSSILASRAPVGRSTLACRPRDLLLVRSGAAGLDHSVWSVRRHRSGDRHADCGCRGRCAEKRDYRGSRDLRGSESGGNLHLASQPGRSGCFTGCRRIGEQSVSRRQWVARGPGPTTALPFVTFTGASSGSGSGVLSFVVAVNSGAETMPGTFTVAGLSFDVEQQAASIASLNFIGSMAHLAARGELDHHLHAGQQGRGLSHIAVKFFGRRGRSHGQRPADVALDVPAAIRRGGTAGGRFLRRNDRRERFLYCDDCGTANSAGAGRLRATFGHGFSGRVRDFSPDSDCAGSGGAAGDALRELLSAPLRQH